MPRSATGDGHRWYARHDLEKTRDKRASGAGVNQETAPILLAITVVGDLCGGPAARLDWTDAGEGRTIDHMMHPTPTVYADLNAVLYELVTTTRAILADNFCGAYLQG